MKKTVLTCDVCEAKFERKTSEVNRHIKQGRKWFFCSLSCCGRSRSNLERIRQYRKPGRKKGEGLDEFSPFRRTLGRIKSRAKSTNKEMNLDLEYLKELWDNQKGICPYTGWKLILQTTMNEKEFVVNLASLDRIDNSKGYIKGNVRYVSIIYNYCRNSFSDDDVLKFAEAIVANQGAKGID